MVKSHPVLTKTPESNLLKGSRFYHEPVDKIVGRCVWTTIDHDVHRMRRGAFSSYFSRAKVLELQPRISEKVELLRERILTWEGSSEPLNLYEAFSALTLGK